MSDTFAWGIALAFYAPIHFLGPALVAFLIGPDAPRQSRALINRVFIDCSLSMVVAFALAIPLFRHAPGLAAGVLLLAMTAPYVHLWVRLRRAPRRGV